MTSFVETCRFIMIVSKHDMANWCFSKKYIVYTAFICLPFLRLFDYVAKQTEYYFVRVAVHTNTLTSIGA